MITGILLLSLMIFALSWLFGLGKPERLLKLIVWLIFGPLLLALLYNEWLSFFSGLPLAGQIALVIAVPFFLLFALTVMFPGSRGVSITVDVLWNFLIFLLTFPARLLWRSGRQIADRERNRIRLQRNLPIVGGRPPLVTQRQRVDE